MDLRFRFVALLTVAVAWLGCTVTDPLTNPIVDNPPVTRQRSYSLPPGALEKVAVIPFAASFQASPERLQRAITPIGAADEVAELVTEALLARGIATVAPSDVAEAARQAGFEIPRDDPISATEFAANRLGATAVMLGVVTRYRERGGTVNPGASVAFELSLYEASDGRKAWVSTFDETQRALSQNVVNARRYPGGGTRWLTARELAKWGATSAIDALPKRR